MRSRSPLAVSALVTVLVLVGAATLSGCGSSAPDDAANSTEPTTSSSSVVLPHGMGPPPTEADGSVPPTIVLPQSPLGPWSLDVESSEGFPANGERAGLVAVRTSMGEGTQRIVFEFASDTAPSWQLGYEPSPALADPGGGPAVLTGSVALVVRLAPATLDTAFTGPRRVEVDGGGPAREVALVGDVATALTWAIGLDARVPFAVDTLPSPGRLVIDLLAATP